VAILITDGPPSTASLSVLAEARAAHLAGITVFAVGMSSTINQTELLLISSMPRLRYRQWWSVTSYANLSPIQPMVIQELCRPEYRTLSAQYCIYSVLWAVKS